MSEIEGMELDASWTGILMDIGKERKTGPIAEFSTQENIPDGNYEGDDALRINFLAAVALTHPTTWGSAISVQVALCRTSRNDQELRESLVTLGAATVAWIEAIDRRNKKPALV